MIFGPTTSSFKANVEFASDFESFLTKFQSLKPLIHLFYEQRETLLRNVMAKFVKSKYLTNKMDGEKCAVSAN